MEDAEARDLDQVVRLRGPLPVGEAIDLLIQGARALEAFHGQGTVHGDVSPFHLMLDDSGTVHLREPGSAAPGHTGWVQPVAPRPVRTGPEIDASTESPRGSARSFDFRAPEKMEGPDVIDPRADIYSLGRTLYFLLTARSPREAGPPPTLLAARPDVPMALEEAFQKMIAERPDDRPESTAAAIALLEACKASPASAATTVGERATSRPKRTVASPTMDRSAEPQPPRPVPKILLRPARRDRRPAIVLAMALFAAMGFAFVRWADRDINRRAPEIARDRPNVDQRPLVPAPKTTAVSIFDGKTARGWMLCNAKPLPAAHVQRDGLNPHGTGSYLVVYRRKLGDFVLDFDYKLSEGCDSGVFLRVGDLNDPVRTGIEVALADTTGTGLDDSGAFHGLVAPIRNAQKPTGHWNHMTIMAAGPTLAVSINDVDVTRINLDEWTTPGKRPDGTDHPFKSIAVAGLPRNGYFGFQNLRGDCWFKNIVLKTQGLP
jgi:hypothetical protein